jgi:hypothetical protein
MNKKKCVYIFNVHPIFNDEAVKDFENLSVQDSILLYSNLNANFIEVLAGNDLNVEIIYCLDERDKDHIPINFFPDKSKIFFINNENIKFSLERLNQNYFTLFENNVLILADAIGFSEQNIHKIFDLLAIEDDALVIGQSKSKTVAFIGFNSVDKKLLEELFLVKYDYEQFLPEAGKRDLFLTTLHGFQLIENFNDFRNLYFELSKKESLNYCSQRMHESFTNLFIEYKDLLK